MKRAFMLLAPPGAEVLPMPLAFHGHVCRAVAQILRPRVVRPSDVVAQEPPNLASWTGRFWTAGNLGEAHDGRGSEDVLSVAGPRDNWGATRESAGIMPRNGELTLL